MLDLPHLPRVALVGGVDPFAGAGVLADASTVQDIGVLPLVVVTGVVPQDSHRVVAIHPVSSVALDQQLDCVQHDGSPTVWKLGALLSSENIDLLCDRLAQLPGPRPPVWVVVDPVLRSGQTVGTALIDEGARAAYVSLLTRLGAACCVTPNASELGALLSTRRAEDLDELQAQAKKLHERTGACVLAKGGHIRPQGTDVLVAPVSTSSWPPIGTWPHADVHGTGCHLASAVAAFLAHGRALPDAVDLARRYLYALAMAHTLHVGSGRPQFVHVTPCDAAMSTATRTPQVPHE